MLDDTDRKSILIIEDDPVHRRLMESELNTLYDLDFASDGETALARLEHYARPYHLVIMDLRLPYRIGEPAEIDVGFRILEALAADSVRPVVLVVSGNVIDRTRQQIEKLGQHHIYEKPFSLKKFRQSIMNLLGEHQAEVTAVS